METRARKKIVIARVPEEVEAKLRQMKKDLGLSMGETIGKLYDLAEDLVNETENK